MPGCPVMDGSPVPPQVEVDGLDGLEGLDEAERGEARARRKAVCGRLAALAEEGAALRTALGEAQRRVED